MAETNNEKITSSDIPYVAANRLFLQEKDWAVAKQKFILFQPEHRELDKLKQQHEELVAEISPINEKLQKLQEELCIKQEKQDKEYQALENISNLKNKLLPILPPLYRADAKKFLNDFVLHENSDISFPWKKVKSLKEKLVNKLHFIQLDKFEKAFAEMSKDFSDFSPRFDILKDKNSIEGDIKNYYKTASLRQEIEVLSQEKEKIEKQQYSIAAQMGKNRIALDDKIATFKHYFDKHLFYDAENSTTNENDEIFEKLSENSQLWERIFVFAKHQNINFEEKFLLFENDKPVIVTFDKENNKILYNKHFVFEEQLYYIAELLLEMSAAKPKESYNARAAYQHSLCANADIVAKLMVLNRDFSPIYPKFQSYVEQNYISEYYAFLTGKNPDDCYAKAFIAALASDRLRERAECETREFLEKKSGDIKCMDISLGEIISPYTNNGLPLIAENKKMQMLLEQISVSTQSKLQVLADKTNDNSLKAMTLY